jgi:hypothetical protein
MRNCLAQRFNLKATSKRLAAGQRAAISCNSGSRMTRQNFFSVFIYTHFPRRVGHWLSM